MRCDEIMKKDVQCIRPDEDIKTASRRMREQNIGFLPVCENGMKPMGTITDRDIVIRVCAEEKPVTTRIRDVMSREVIACKPTDDFRTAEELMSKHHKSRVMVCDDAGKLVGVISLSDVAVREEAKRAAETMRQVSSREVRV